jgi:hypothetical protein
VNESIIEGQLAATDEFSPPPNFTIIMNWFTIQQGKSIPLNIYGGSSGKIDTSVSEILTPNVYCSFIERTIGIKKDSATGLYLVNDTMHGILLKSNPTFIFNISLADAQGYRSPYSTNIWLTIEFPYASMLLNLTHPVNETNNYYLPFKCTDEWDGFILGRAFMRRAYMIVNKDNWYVARANLDPNTVPNPVGFNGSVVYVAPIPIIHHKLSARAIAGIAVAAVTGAVLAVLSIWFWKRRVLRQRQNMNKSNVNEDMPPPYHLDPLPVYRE